MPYQKKNLTPAQRSEQARKASAARKNKRGGRPKGWTKDPALKTAKVMRSIGVYEEDYHTFRKLADWIGKTMADTMHGIAVRRIEDNPKIFSAKEKAEPKM